MLVGRSMRDDLVSASTLDKLGQWQGERDGDYQNTIAFGHGKGEWGG
jgi:hypothetical protein